MSTPVGSGLGTLFYCIVDATIVQGYDSDTPEAGYKNWCGVGSTLMALTGIETYNRNALISGYTRPTQSEIAPNVMEPNVINGDSVVWKIGNYLNSKLTANKYTYTEITSSISKNDVKQYIIHSLSNNRPVILHSMPYNAFAYYSCCGYTGGHYLIVEDYNSYMNTYTVVDCTYVNYNSNNDVYHGRHTGVTIDEIYNSLYYIDTSNAENNITGRYIIYA